MALQVDESTKATAEESPCLTTSALASEVIAKPNSECDPPNSSSQTTPTTGCTDFNNNNPDVTDYNYPNGYGQDVWLQQSFQGGAECEPRFPDNGVPTVEAAPAVTGDGGGSQQCLATQSTMSSSSINNVHTANGGIHVNNRHQVYSESSAYYLSASIGGPSDSSYSGNYYQQQPPPPIAGASFSMTPPHSMMGAPQGPLTYTAVDAATYAECGVLYDTDGSVMYPSYTRGYCHEDDLYTRHEPLRGPRAGSAPPPSNTSDTKHCYKNSGHNHYHQANGGGGNHHGGRDGGRDGGRGGGGPPVMWQPLTSPLKYPPIHWGPGHPPPSSPPPALPAPPPATSAYNMANLSFSGEQGPYWAQNGGAGSSIPAVPVELQVTNLDQNIDAREMKKILLTFFREHVMVLHVSMLVQSDGNLAASLRVPSPQDAQYAISQLHRKKIGSKRIIISYVNHNQPSPELKRSKVISLLLEVPGKKLPLFKFRELYERRFHETIGVSEMYNMRDIVTVSDNSTGRMVALHPEYRHLTQSSQSHSEPNEVTRFCPKHSSGPDASIGWAERDNTTCLPNVDISLGALAENMRCLLNSHNGVLPLASLVDCYTAECGPVVEVLEGGVPLEHLVSCLPDVSIDMSIGGFKFIQWSKNKLPQEEMEDLTRFVSPSLVGQLSLFSRELVDLLKTFPHTRLPFPRFIPAYHHHFGRQCRVADYGFTKLAELFDALPHVVQVLGEGTKRLITLAHRAQVKRFSSDLLRVLKGQPAKVILLSQFAVAYEKIVGKAWDVTDYGVNNIDNLLSEVNETTVLVTRSPDDVTIAIPKREQTPDEVEKTRQFGAEVVELLRHSPQCKMQFNRFIPAYHHHFGRQCRVADYGFTKLIELFEAIPDLLEVFDDEEDGEKQLQLVEREKLRVLGDQIVLVVKGAPRHRLSTDALRQVFTHYYGYALRPQHYGHHSLYSLLLALSNYVRVSGPGPDALVTVVDRCLAHTELARARAVLWRTPHCAMPLTAFVDQYRVEHGAPPNMDLLTADVDQFVKVSKGPDGRLVQLAGLQVFARDLLTLLQEAGGRMLLSNFETAYIDRFGLPCRPARFGFASLVALVQALADLVTVKGRGAKKLLLLLARDPLPGPTPSSISTVTSTTGDTDVVSSTSAGAGGDCVTTTTTASSDPAHSSSATTSAGWTNVTQREGTVDSSCVSVDTVVAAPGGTADTACLSTVFPELSVSSIEDDARDAQVNKTTDANLFASATTSGSDGATISNGITKVITETVVSSTEITSRVVIARHCLVTAAPAMERKSLPSTTSSSAICPVSEFEAIENDNLSTHENVFNSSTHPSSEKDNSFPKELTMSNSFQSTVPMEDNLASTRPLVGTTAAVTESIVTSLSEVVLPVPILNVNTQTTTTVIGTINSSNLTYASGAHSTNSFRRSGQNSRSIQSGNSTSSSISVNGSSTQSSHYSSRGGYRQSALSSFQGPSSTRGSNGPLNGSSFSSMYLRNPFAPVPASNGQGPDRLYTSTPHASTDSTEDNALDQMGSAVQGNRSDKTGHGLQGGYAYYADMDQKRQPGYNGSGCDGAGYLNGGYRGYSQDSRPYRNRAGGSSYCNNGDSRWKNGLSNSSHNTSSGNCRQEFQANSHQASYYESGHRGSYSGGGGGGCKTSLSMAPSPGGGTFGGSPYNPRRSSFSRHLRPQPTYTNFQPAKHNGAYRESAPSSHVGDGCVDPITSESAGLSSPGAVPIPGGVRGDPGPPAMAAVAASPPYDFQACLPDGSSVFMNVPPPHQQPYQSSLMFSGSPVAGGGASVMWGQIWSPATQYPAVIASPMSTTHYVIPPGLSVSWGSIAASPPSLPPPPLAPPSHSARQTVSMHTLEHPAQCGYNVLHSADPNNGAAGYTASGSDIESTSALHQGQTTVQNLHPFSSLPPPFLVSAPPSMTPGTQFPPPGSYDLMRGSMTAPPADPSNIASSQQFLVSSAATEGPPTASQGYIFSNAGSVASPSSSTYSQYHLTQPAFATNALTFDSSFSTSEALPICSLDTNFFSPMLLQPQQAFTSQPLITSSTLTSSTSFTPSLVSSSAGLLNAEFALSGDDSQGSSSLMSPLITPDIGVKIAPTFSLASPFTSAPVNSFPAHNADMMNNGNIDLSATSMPVSANPLEEPNTAEGCGPSSGAVGAPTRRLAAQFTNRTVGSAASTAEKATVGSLNVVPITSNDQQ